MAELKLWEQYVLEAREAAEKEGDDDENELEEGKDNVNTSDKQKNPQPEGDPNKKAITNPGE